MNKRPYILTIAGFDPSGGAGILADIKTMEALKTYGVSVCTANTIQNDIVLKTCHWIDIEVVKEQITLLFSRFKIEVVKIGIIQNFKMLYDIVAFLKQKNKNIKIIVDPVLRSSSGYDFNVDSTNATQQFEAILDKIYLLTPNYEEIQTLYSELTIEQTIEQISKRTNLFLKGGHREDTLGKDQLFTKAGKMFVLNPKGQHISEKHGSGCVLSSAIASYIALGFPLLKACYRAKRYTEKVLSSNIGLLGYHRI